MLERATRSEKKKKKKKAPPIRINLANCKYEVCECMGERRG
jgi:hypothetical protein